MLYIVSLLLPAWRRRKRIYEKRAKTEVGGFGRAWLTKWRDVYDRMLAETGNAPTARLKNVQTKGGDNHRYPCPVSPLHCCPFHLSGSKWLHAFTRPQSANSQSVSVNHPFQGICHPTGATALTLCVSLPVKRWDMKIHIIYLYVSIGDCMWTREGCFWKNKTKGRQGLLSPLFRPQEYVSSTVRRGLQRCRAMQVRSASRASIDRKRHKHGRRAVQASHWFGAVRTMRTHFQPQMHKFVFLSYTGGLTLQTKSTGNNGIHIICGRKILLAFLRTPLGRNPNSNYL